MANVIHRTTLEFRRSANEPDFPEPTWKWNPDMAGVAGVPEKYWKAPADWDAGGAGPVEMTAPEKAAVDAVLDAALVALNRNESTAAVDTTAQATGWSHRALIAVFNQRDNYIINRLEEIQLALDAVKASTGPADNIRAAIPASWLATATRDRPAAIMAYKDEISGGGADS